MKTTVIHHSADYDGIFCREIARKFLPDAELIGWDYTDPKIPFPSEGTVYVLDLSPDCFDGLWVPARTIWIDHHKSSIDKYDGPDDPEANLKTTPRLDGYRIDGVAACRLAWQWFANPDGNHALPVKESYLVRNVSEPLAVRLAGEYDIWDHRGDGDLEFQFGLDSRPNLLWDILLTTGHDDYAEKIIDDGKKAMACYAKRDADVVRTRSFIQEFDGLKFLTLTTAKCNSNTFNAKDIPETGHDALMAFYYNGKGWNFSLYHASHRRELDLSAIAVKYGGGGHRGACGFRTEKLPF